MYASKFFISTLKEAPAEAELISHKLNFLKALPSIGETKYNGLLPSGNNPNDLYYQSGFKNYLINFLGLRETENEKEMPSFDILRSLETVKKVYGSEDLKEGASSFVKKTDPNWKDK